jgi:hypothetical protein
MNQANPRSGFGLDEWLAGDFSALGAVSLFSESVRP